jgi:hypothetical protein
VSLPRTSPAPVVVPSAAAADEGESEATSDAESALMKLPPPPTSAAAEDLSSSGFISPISSIPPKFNVDADVLARSPMGSVADLSTVQSDNESLGGGGGGGGGERVSGPLSANGDQENEKAKVDEAAVSAEDSIEVALAVADVAITVTSPKGTERRSPAGAEESLKADRNGDCEADASGKQLKDGNDVIAESEFTNAQGVIFTPTADMVDESGSLIPYGLPCVRELFRFLVSLTNPHDSHNQDSMIQIALSLLATALETGAQHLDKFDSLLILVKDDLARNLVSLLSAERIGTFASALWVSISATTSKTSSRFFSTG